MVSPSVETLASGLSVLLLEQLVKVPDMWKTFVNCCTFRPAWAFTEDLPLLVSITEAIFPLLTGRALLCITLVSKMLRDSRLLCSLVLSGVFTRHLGHFGKASFPLPD